MDAGHSRLVGHAMRGTLVASNTWEGSSNLLKRRVVWFDIKNAISDDGH